MGNTKGLMQLALKTIHGKAGLATRKFRLLNRAIDTALASFGFMGAAAIAAVIQ
jgi:hypothetical protein